MATDRYNLDSNLPAPQRFGPRGSDCTGGDAAAISTASAPAALKAGTIHAAALSESAELLTMYIQDQVIRYDGHLFLVLEKAEA